jgi:hypothetical protein
MRAPAAAKGVTVMPTDRTSADPDAARTPAAIETLIDGMLRDGGCACRFPRFRATVARNTVSFGVPLMTWEQYLLITLHDRRVTLRNKRPLVRPGEGTGYTAECARCGAVVSRLSLEFQRDQWHDRITVRPKPGVEDLGAAVAGALPHCWRFFSVAGSERERAATDCARRDAEITYPRLLLDDWLAWMGERRV